LLAEERDGTFARHDLIAVKTRAMRGRTPSGAGVICKRWAQLQGVEDAMSRTPDLPFPNDAEGRSGMERIAEQREFERASEPRDGAVEAWFLGPKAENADLLEQLILEALRDHVYWRRNFHPGDPGHITEAMRHSEEYIRAVGVMRDELRATLALLKRSVPFFSMRYQGHMLWDTTLPSTVGYFAAMLHNQNNASFEASPVTSVIELLAGQELCRMVGYPIDEAEADSPRPWGHITCDGTVANIEALWAARNLKLLPLATRAALIAEPELAAARRLEVRSAGCEPRPLLELDSWQALNVPEDEALALPERLRALGISPELLERSLRAHSVQTLGLARFFREQVGADIGEPAVIVPATAHYSLTKAMALLGLGAGNLICVPVDPDARMDPDALARALASARAERRPVVAVVAVLGSTETGAVDPLLKVLALRDSQLSLGLSFHVHADAAWGGYFTCVERQSAAARGTPGAQPELPAPGRLSAYVGKQLAALSWADTVTVDPHKSGYVPYPAGALCYRNSRLRHLIRFAAPYVVHGVEDPDVGIFGIEGSKPGASAVSVYLSHRVIPADRSGYGKIISQALVSCRRLYLRLLTLARDGDPFRVIPVPRLEAERARAGADRESEELQALGQHAVGLNDADVLADAEASQRLRDLGPDLNILTYAFNFVGRDGELNPDLDALNRLNLEIYRRLRVQPGEEIYGYRLLVSHTRFSESEYGPAFMDELKRRLGVRDATKGDIDVLRSVVMDPWVTDTPQGSFIEILAEEFRSAVLASLRELSARGSIEATEVDLKEKAASKPESSSPASR